MLIISHCNVLLSYSYFNLRSIKPLTNGVNDTDWLATVHCCSGKLMVTAVTDSRTMHPVTLQKLCRNSARHHRYTPHEVTCLCLDRHSQVWSMMKPPGIIIIQARPTGAHSDLGILRSGWYFKLIFRQFLSSFGGVAAHTVLLGGTSAWVDRVNARNRGTPAEHWTVAKQSMSFSSPVIAFNTVADRCKHFSAWLLWLCHLFNRFLWLQTVCSAAPAHCCAGVSPPLCVSVSYIMLCSSGMKLVRETGRSLEPEVEEPAMARNHTHLMKWT